MFRVHSLIALCGTLLLVGCSTTTENFAAKVNNETVVNHSQASTTTETGVASFYSDKFNGRRTANGEIFHNKKLTAAHRTLPFGTYVKVTALWNGRSVVVKINDRGPFIKGRVIDLSKAAAAKLHLIGRGVGKVDIEVVPAP